MKYPLILIVLSMILGIFSYPYNTDIVNIICSIFFTFTGFSFYLYYKKDKIKFNFSLFLVFICFGYCISFLQDPLNNKNHYSNKKELNNIGFLIQIEQELKPSLKYNRFIAEVKEINKENCNGKILFCVKKNEISKPKIGNNILVFDKIVKIPLPKNKYQFDYNKYMNNKDVFGQTYTTINNIKIIDYQRNINSISNEIRQNIIKAFEKQEISSSSLAIIKALLLGEKQDIDKETYQSYSQSGAVHVLAISGLHIGLILMFLYLILTPLKYFKYHKEISTIIILTFLWSFAVISGLSASVVRAVTMFSFVSFALFFKRKTLIYNTLLGSLFILLIFKPKFIYDVGFQLSYLAVFSIVFIQPILNKYYYPKNIVIRYFYNIFTVSIAAQLGVMPLSIYYFHQFPGLFFITNVLIIPLITIILFLGIVTVLISFINEIPSLLIKIIDILVYLTNSIVTKISSFDNFVISHIYNNMILLILTSLNVLLLFLYVKKRNYINIKHFLISILISFIVYFSYVTINYYKDENILLFDSKELIIIKKDGEGLFIFSNEKTKDNQDLENYKRENFIKSINYSKINNFIEINSKKILVIDKSLNINKVLKPDILIIHNNPKINLERLLEKIEPKKVIFSTKNYKNNIDIWKRVLTIKNIEFYNMYEEGAYIID